MGNPEHNGKLLECFNVIGVLPQLARSTCLIKIEILGNIPPQVQLNQYTLDTSCRSWRDPSW